MFEVIQSDTFARWLKGLKDRQALYRIQARIARIEVYGLDGLGDAKPIRQGVSELRIHYGPGYRIYFMRSGSTVVVLLAGGDKSTQAADTERALEIASQWKE